MENIINKKGSLTNFIVIILFILVIGIISGISFKINKTMGEKIADIKAIKEDETASKEQARINNLGRTVPDFVFILLFFGLIIAGFISIIYTDFSPLGIFLFILFLGIAVFLLTIAKDIFQPLQDKDIPFTSFIFSKYGVISFIGVLVLLIIIMFSKSGGSRL